MNYLQTIKLGSNKLRLRNIKSHALDSELLLSYILNSSREKLLTNLKTKIKKKKVK